MTLEQPTLGQFLDELASAAPAPGGGSAAAYVGALGAALVAMVCRLTIGRKSYQGVSAEFETVLPRAEELRHELHALMEQDSDAYNAVMSAYQLPKVSNAETQARSEAIQSALKHAAEIPLRVATVCGEVLEMSAVAAAKGNKNAASDAGAGATMAEAGLTAALLNVEINLGLIRDEAFVNALRVQITPLQRIALKRQAILDTVQSRL